MLKKYVKPVVAILFLFTITALFAANETPKTLFNAKANNIVYYVPQFSEFKAISEQDRFFLKKVLQRAERNNIKAVIFELDTPGGSIEIAIKYLSILEKSKVPVIAYLNPNGISAGAIIALGADRIAISPNGLIGDAMMLSIGIGGVKPITNEPPSETGKSPKKQLENTEKTVDKKAQKAPKKTEGILEKLKNLNSQKKTTLNERERQLVNQKRLTVFYKSLQVLAEKNHRPVRVIRAMADPYQKLTLEKDGFEHSKVSPLTLSAKEAKKLNVVDYLCTSKEDLLNQLGLNNCELKIIKKTPTEQLMSFLSHPLIAGALLMLGLIGMYVEIRSPGFGVPGILGVTALTMFFLGHVASGASDWGPMVIFFVGVGLIALEIFVIPGFGVVGILGMLCIMISLFGAFGFENINTAVNVVGLSILSAIAISVVLSIYILPKSTLFKRITLSTSQDSNAGYSAPHQEDQSLLGKIGIVHSKLRPSGSVIINDKHYDATATGEFIEPGTKVQVVSLTGFQLTVKAYKDSPKNDPSDNYTTIS